MASLISQSTIDEINALYEADRQERQREEEAHALRQELIDTFSVILNSDAKAEWITAHLLERFIIERR